LSPAPAIRLAHAVDLLLSQRKITRRTIRPVEGWLPGSGWITACSSNKQVLAVLEGMPTSHWSGQPQRAPLATAGLFFSSPWSHCCRCTLSTRGSLWDVA